MTDKEIRKLTRADLLELLIIERREIDRLSEECKRLRRSLRYNKEENEKQPTQ